MAGISTIFLVSTLIASGPIVISGEKNVVISGLKVTNPNGTCIRIENNSSNITIENSEIGPCSQKGIHIVSGSSNIRIHNNYMHDIPEEAVMSYRTNDIAVDSNVIENIGIGYAMWDTPVGNLSFTNNFVKNVTRVNGVGGNVVAGRYLRAGGIRITDNIGINVLGQSNSRDLINMWKSSGLPGDPILISRNKFNGGGPDPSSGGIMLGDQNGSYTLSEDNILVNPGQYGLTIAGGHNNVHRNNKVYSDNQRDFTNVGVVVWRYGGKGNGTPPGGCYGNTVESNEITFWKGPNYKGKGNSAYRAPYYNPDYGNDNLSPNCGSVAGWNTNKFDTKNAQPANLDSSLWNPTWNTPSFLPQNPFYY